MKKRIAAIAKAVFSKSGSANVATAKSVFGKALFAGSILCLCLAVVPALAARPAPAAQAPSAGAVDTARRLTAAYPDAGMSLEQAPDGLYIRIGGERLLFSPAAGCPPATPDQIADAPLCALFSQPYPAGQGGRYPAPGFDPGRVRSEALLKLLYGRDRAEVESRLVAMTLAGEHVRVSSRHGAAAALARVIVRLESLMREEPAARAYILPVAGSYFWRAIQGSHRLSAHSFGIAVDLNVNKGLYWQWVRSKTDPRVERARRDYPQAVVDAFEAEGFIWGGKWDAFDFMHFEYRPELMKR